MKEICNKAKTCKERQTCDGAVPHYEENRCYLPCVVNRNARCVPVRPKRKAVRRQPVTVWRVTIDFKTHWQARYIYRALKQGASGECLRVRGPVKVVLE